MEIERNAKVPARSTAPLTAAEFADVFAQGWALAKPEPFLDHFLPVIHPEATFAQPIFPTAHGVDGVERLFRQLFIQIPDLTAEVQRSAVSGDTIYIESLCTGTLGPKPIRFGVCDVFRIDDGLIVERRSFLRSASRLARHNAPTGKLASCTAHDRVSMALVTARPGSRDADLPICAWESHLADPRSPASSSLWCVRVSPPERA